MHTAAARPTTCRRCHQHLLLLLLRELVRQQRTEQIVVVGRRRNPALPNLSVGLHVMLLVLAVLFVPLAAQFHRGRIRDGLSPLIPSDLGRALGDAGDGTHPAARVLALLAFCSAGAFLSVLQGPARTLVVDAAPPEQQARAPRP